MKTIVLSPPFHKDSGFAFLQPLARGIVPPGDSSEAPKQSPVLLFENDVPLGPSHSPHYAIREQGMGRYSHWNDTLFFATSDNSDPNRNGRRYCLAVPSEEELGFYRRTMLEGVGADPSLTFAVLRASHNTNGSALALYAKAFGSYRAAMQRAGIDLRDRTILEIGSGPRLGVALALLLHGARHVISNDIGPIGRTIATDYARIIQWMSKLVTSHQTTPLTGIVERPPVDATELTLRPERFTALPLTPAEDIALPEGSVDLVVSTSVLEHVMKPREVIERTFRLLAPGGWCIHSIDLRDHANPLAPLGFLERSRADYEPGGTENRVRALDWVAIFERAGFVLANLDFDDGHVPVDESGNIDGMAAFLADRSDGAGHHHPSLDAVVPWVTDEMRAAFDPEFRSRGLQELSVLGLTVIAKRPA